MGRRDAVEVPRRRLRRPLGRAARRRDRDAVVREPALRPGGTRAAARGLAAEEAVARLTGADDGRAHRQLGIVDGEGRAATFTGAECHAWAGGRTGAGYAAQGNILVSGATVDALAETFEATAGRRSPSGCSTASTRRRRRAATAAAGSPPRSSSSSATAATRLSPTRSSTSASTTTPTRSASCVASTGCTTPCSAARLATGGCRVDDELRAELDERLGRAGHASLAAWAGVENLEERVDGDDEIDPIVLERLREAT